MFTDLSFLEIGKNWTPNNATYKKRQENYINGRLLYEGEIEAVFNDTWSSIASRYGKSYEEVEQVMIKLNLFRSLTETFKLLAFQKLPEVKAYKSENTTDADVLEDNEFSNKKLLKLLKKGFISAHAQGESVLKVYTNSKGEADLAVVDAENWIPVYNPENLDEITHHVVANTYEVDNTSNLLGINFTKSKKYLNVEIHQIGKYEKRLYELDKDNVIKSLLNSEEVKTGYDGFAVFPFNYGTPAWRDYGISAYIDIMPIVDELIVRYSNNSKILDDHADPQLIVPREALEFDQDSGQWLYKRHSATVGYGKNGEKPEYMTWDGSLTSSETQIDKLTNLFYIISGTNPQLFGQDIAGNLSGEALAKILIVPLGKTREMLLSLEDAFEEALNCILKIKNINKKVEIQFEVGAFNSLSDVVARVVQEKNAGITSLKRAIEQINPRYDEEDINNELNLIREDNKANSMTDIEDLFPNDDKENDKNNIDE